MGLNHLLLIVTDHHHVTSIKYSTKNGCGWSLLSQGAANRKWVTLGNVNPIKERASNRGDAEGDYERGAQVHCRGCAG